MEAVGLLLLLWCEVGVSMNLPYAMQLRDRIERNLESSQFYLMMGQILVDESVRIKDEGKMVDTMKEHARLMKKANWHSRRAERLNRKYVRLMRKLDDYSTT
ncbi:MAG: hypothetical protein BWY50_02033 [Spirochaetes bacterium ADurb.Bin315]|nr:MAG: hypothetical protein BWY50_02033 [Spirochaetes bacterium ADurb.Bin315]